MGFVPLALLALSFASLSSSMASLFIDVTSLGAKPDGRTDSTKQFMAAWNLACRSHSPAIIYVPRGSFLLGTINFLGPCHSAIAMQIKGTLVAPSKYFILGNSITWILFEFVDGLTLSGGQLDGQGASLWTCKKFHKDCPIGATSLEFANSTNVVINRLTSLNSQLFHIVTIHCKNVEMNGIQITADGNSPNTDGIHLHQTNNVTIRNTKISTGDDCVSIGPGTSNVLLENITCGPGHGISIGSLGKKLKEAGVQNVTVRGATLNGTRCGLRIKAWGKPSNGYAKNIVFEDVEIDKVRNPIVISQFYCPYRHCPRRRSGVKVSDVTFKNIRGTSATDVAVLFDCCKSNPCSGIRMEDVNLSFGRSPASASCTNAGGIAFGSFRPNRCLNRI